jgi:hypothetical protein
MVIANSSERQKTVCFAETCATGANNPVKNATIVFPAVPTHVLGMAKYTHGLTFLLKGVFGGQRCTVLLDTGASTCFVHESWLKKARENQHCWKRSGWKIHRALRWQMTNSSQ